MKKTKLFNALIPTVALSTVASMALPLASCACKTDKVRLTSEAHKTTDSTYQATYTFETDKEYKVVDVEMESDSKDYFNLWTSTDGRKVTVIVQLITKYQGYINDDTKIDFSLKFNGADWNAKVSGLSITLKANGDKDKAKVNKINEIIKGVPLATMSQLLALLKINNVDLENETTSSETTQWVWDCSNGLTNGGVVFVMNEDGTVRSAPDSYELPKDQVNIWKMVTGETTLKSSKNITAKKDKFSSTCPYSQFLRTGETFKKSLEFISGLDTGAHTEGFELKFNRDSTEETKAILNTQNCELSVTNKSITEVHHYGHLKTLTVDTLPAEGSYTEWGTVDARVVLNSGTLNAEDGSYINDVLVTSDDVKEVNVNEGGGIGAVVVASGVDKEADKITNIDPKAEIKPETPTVKPDEETIKRYAGGIGTLNSPYAISKPEHLLNAQADVNATDESYPYPKPTGLMLLNDIDMTGVTTFTHIGTPSSPFTGVFDGQGYTIKNLSIKKDIDPSKKEVYAGLIGYIKGTPISGCDRTTIWDDIEKKVNYDTCLTIDSETGISTKFTASIMNLTLESVSNVDYKDLESRFIGGIVGRADDALIYNCHVTSGEIKGKKHMGGICGAMNSSLFYDCSTGTDLTIECDEYNCGGICGSASACDGVSKASCDIFGYCVNNATVKAMSKAAVGGNLSGICALAGGSDPSMGTVFDNCTNNGKIISKNLTGSGKSPNPSGISSDAHRTFICSNCINNGEIKIEDGFTSAYASGLLSYSQAKVYKCQNNAKVSGYADYMAGILAYQSSDYFVINEFYDVGNKGEISNAKTTELGGITGPIVASANANVILIDKVYDTVEDLNADIQSASAVSITLQNVTVKNTEGTLNIKPAIMSVTSDKKVCSNVVIGGSTVTIDMPDTDITVDGDHHETYLYVRGDNSDLIVNEGASLLAATVGGDSSTLTNSGTIQSFTMTNRCVDSTNTSKGFIGNIGFDSGTWKESTALPEKHFTNYGTIHTQGRTCHTISTISDDVKITLENYNLIKSEDSWYLFLFYTSQNCVVKSYAGSVAEIAGTSAGICATHETIISYYQEAKGEKAEAKVIDKGVEKKWTDYTWYFEHHKIED